MKKKEFMTKLRNELNSIDKEDLDELLADYEEHIDIGVKKKRKEEAVIKALGSPSSIAKQILADYRIDQAEKKVSASNIGKAIVAAAGLGFLNLVFIFGPFMGLVGVLVGMFAAGIGLTIGGFLLLFSIIFKFTPGIEVSGINAIGFVLISIGLIALGLFLLDLSKMALRLFYKTGIKYLKWNANIVREGSK